MITQAKDGNGVAKNEALIHEMGELAADLMRVRVQLAVNGEPVDGCSCAATSGPVPRKPERVDPASLRYAREAVQLMERCCEHQEYESLLEFDRGQLRLCIRSEQAEKRALSRELRSASEDLTFSGGATAIMHERRRQIVEESHTHDADDRLTKDQLVRAAIFYATPPSLFTQATRKLWPFRRKPKDTYRRTSLIFAGALIAAEIDRLDRAAAASAPEGGAEPTS